MSVPLDSQRAVTGRRLLEAAQDFWEACHAEGQHGAVQWLEAGDGQLVVLTRGEYRETLLANVHRLPGQPEVAYFTVPDEEGP